MKNHLKEHFYTLFHKKSHKNPNFTRKSNHKQKEIVLHEKSLKRTTFTCFSIKNCIKAQALHANHSTNIKRNILLHENHLKEQPLHVFPT